MPVYLKLFYIFSKVGIFAFGGGYVILPMIYQEIQSFGIMSAKEFSDIIALSQVTPGPIAVTAATYTGYKAAGLWGASLATIGVILPSFIIVLIVSVFLNKFKTSPAVQAVLSGIRPAAAGMIASAVIFFAETSIVSEEFFSLKMFSAPLKHINFPSLVIFGLIILGSEKLKRGPITLTILAGILGVFIF